MASPYLVDSFAGRKANLSLCFDPSTILWNSSFISRRPTWPSQVYQNYSYFRSSTCKRLRLIELYPRLFQSLNRLVASSNKALDLQNANLTYCSIWDWGRCEAWTNASPERYPMNLKISHANPLTWNYSNPNNFCQILSSLHRAERRWIGREERRNLSCLQISPVTINTGRWRSKQWFRVNWTTLLYPKLEYFDKRQKCSKLRQDSRK